MNHPGETIVGLTTTWFDSITQLDSGFVDQCFAPPLEGRWWYTALEQSALDDQFEFRYLVVYRDGQPTVLVPTFTMDVPMELVAPPLVDRLLRAGGPLLSWLRFQRTLFIGSPCSDEGSIGCAESADLADYLPVIESELDNYGAACGASLLVWKDFPATFWPLLDEHLSGNGYFRIPSFPGTFVDLPPGGFDAYLAMLKSANRYKLRKKLQRSLAQGDLEVACFQRPDQRTREEIFALFMNTYHRGKTKFERLTPEFFSAIAEAPPAWFLTLRDKTHGNMVAFMLLFSMDDKAINKFIGLDYNYSGDWFMYFRLWHEAVHWATAQGAQQLQSGQTGYQPKRELGHRLVPLANYCRHRNRLVNAISAAVGKHITPQTLDDDLPAVID